MRLAARPKKLTADIDAVRDDVAGTLAASAGPGPGAKEEALVEIGKHWETIRAIFEEGRNSCMHFAVATVGKDGAPHVAPIGALFLREDQTGFYFDEFAVTTSSNVKTNPRVCILAVNSTSTFWQSSLVGGRFATPPGVRLMGSFGERRQGTDQEVALWHKRIERTQGTKGYELLWKNMRVVRDIYFDSFEPVSCGAMTQGLWV